MLKLLPTLLFGFLFAFLSDNQSRYVLVHNGTKEYYRKDKLFFCFMVITFALLVGLRLRGNDTSVYRQMYDNIGDNLSYIEGISWTQLSSAPGLQCYCILLKSLGASTQDYLMITAFITIGIYCWFIRKYSRDFLLSIFYFVTMGAYGFTMAAIKQTLAVAFLMVATDRAFQKKWVRFLFWVLIAELFHPYAFIYLLIPLLSFKPWTASTRYLIAGAIVFGFLLGRFMSVIERVTEALGYNYNNATFTGEGVNVFRIAVVWVPLVLSFMKRDYLRHCEDRTMNIIVNLMMVNAVIMFIGLFGTANSFARLANYFILFQVLALPWLLGLFDSSDGRLLKTLSVIGFGAYFYYSVGVIYGGFDARFDFMTFGEYLSSH